MAIFVPKILRHLKNVAFGGITETNGQDAINGLETRKLATNGNGSALTGLTIAQVDDLQKALSSGVISAADVNNIVVSSATAGAVDTTAFNAWFRTSASMTAPLVPVTVAATTANAIPSSTVRYIICTYSGGTGVISVSTSDTSNGWNIICLALVENDAGIIHMIIPLTILRADYSNLTDQRWWEINGVKRASGAMLNSPAALKVGVTAGVYWSKLARLITPALDTNVTGTFWMYYVTGGVWTEVASLTTLPVTQYNNITTGLVTMTNNNYYSYYDVYLGVTDGDVRILYGQAEYTTQLAAQNAPVSASLPLEVSTVAYQYIGRYVFKRNAAAVADTLSVYTSAPATAGNPTTASQVSNVPAGSIAATDIQSAINELDAEKAPVANGVTNGDTHDHVGGDGAQINHTGLSNIGTNTHAQVDTHLALTSLNSHGSTATADIYNTSAIVAAAGTTQGTATALTKQYSFVTSGSGGVKLPTPTSGGLTYVIDNDLATELSIYPNTGGQIDGMAANTAKKLGAYGILVLVSETGTEWISTAGSGAFTPSGDTHPTANKPVGQFFIHTPTGRKVLMQWDGTVWIPIINLGAATMYVDGTSGSDSQNKGYGTGANAFATVQFAVNQIAGLVGGNVVINVAAGTYNETVIVQGKAFTGNYRISFYGAMTVSESLTASAGTAGSGASHGTVTRNSGTWTVNALNGKLIRFTSGVNNGVMRIIDSNTTTVATIVGYWGTIANGDTFNIETWGTSIKKIKCATGQISVDFYYIDVYGDSSTAGYYGLSFSEANFYYSRLSGIPDGGHGFVDLNQSAGLFHACYLYTSGAYTPVIQARTVAFATVKLSKIETPTGTGIGLRILDNSKAFLGLGTGVGAEPCVVEGNTASGNNGIYCYGNGIILSDYGYNKIRNFNRGAFALYGGVQYGRNNNQYSGCTTNELADTASYSFIGD